MVLALILNGCGTGRDLASRHYIPEWDNRAFSIPAPSKTSAEYWVNQSVQKVGKGVGHVLLFPFALLGNILINAYYIPTWPVRRILRGDKRFIVWRPLFGYGEEVRSSYFSEMWNRGLV